MFCTNALIFAVSMLSTLFYSSGSTEPDFGSFQVANTGKFIHFKKLSMLEEP